MAKKIRVLIVEDSLTVRQRLVEVLGADAEIEVVGEAADGHAGISLCALMRPDVITLDIVMPGLSGLEVSEHIMAHYPTPIVIVSSSRNRGEASLTFDALKAGALDVLDKPSGREPDGVWERKLVDTVKTASRIKVITHVRGSLKALRRAATPTPPPASVPQLTPRSVPISRRLVAIGASTGGPAAVIDLLRGLPATFPLPILLVIHVGAPFSDSLVEWLDGLSPIRVSYARDRERLPAGPCVLVAPPDRHLVLEAGVLRHVDQPERHSCRPSIDTLFESIARDSGREAVACLLTGMGRDGAAGLLAIKAAGGLTFAQDEATSMIWGMPGEAVALGAASRVLPLPGMAPALIALASAQEGK